MNPTYLPLLMLLVAGTLIGRHVVAQATLTGQLLDSLTTEPVAFATVYLDGTSNGMVTDDDGRFELTGVTLPVNLVVSHLNYAAYSVGLTETTPLLIRLRPRQTVLTDVTVTGTDARQDNLLEFRRSLLGTDEWGEHASIREDNGLVFDRDYREQVLSVRNQHMRDLLLASDRPGGRWNADFTEYRFEEAANFRVSASQPLLIDLPDLGYQVRMDLRSFLSDYTAKTNSYLATFFFQPVENERDRHRRNRERAYLGSSLHFARALLADSLTENGFAVYEIRRDEAGKQLQPRPADLSQYLEGVGEQVWSLSGLAGREFAIFYYADAKFRPLPESKRKRSQPVQSRFIVLADRCLLTAAGTFADANLLFSGYMGTRGLAWLLPSDYQPPVR